MLDNLTKKGRFLLVYGSATGQAQAIAEDISEKSHKFGLLADLHCLDENDKKFEIESETCLVVVVSTTGDGDAPENAAKFVRKLKRKTLPNTYLQNLSYTILGLGDTNYSNFCRCAKDIDSRLEQLGAKKFYPTGLADDGTGLEIVVDPWLEGLYPALQNFLSITQDMDVSLNEKVTPPPALRDTHYSSSSLPDTDSSGDKDKKLNAASTLTNNNCSESEQMGLPTNSILAQKAEQNALDSSVSSLQSLSINDAVNLATPCIPLPSIPSTTRLTECEVSLSEKELTVPISPPTFLDAKFFNEDDEQTHLLQHQNGFKLPNPASDVFHVPVMSARVLTTPDSVKKTLMLELDIKGCDFIFAPGSSIGIICGNNSSEVDLLLQRLQLTDVADQKVVLSVQQNTTKRNATVPRHIPSVATLRHMFTMCVSIREPPTKALIRTLINYTTNVREVRRLQELCSKEGGEIYTQLVRECHLSLLDLLMAFPSCKPSAERLLEHLPRLLPRPYSIANFPEFKAGTIDIVFNVVMVEADVNKGHFYSRKGVCTGWLDDITKPLQSGLAQKNVFVPIYLRTNQYFLPPQNLSQPIIMIGPGTGVAPFIGFLQQRSVQKSKLSSNEHYGETWLFFGCRNKDRDFLFREELGQFEKSGVLSKLCVAFSRDEPSSWDLNLRYVQDNLRLMAAQICHLITELGAAVYVCGDAKNMAKDISSAFIEILQQEKKMTQEMANQFLMKKRIDRLYIEDVWV